MSCYLGLDIGAVSATAALLIDGDTPSPKSELFENLGEVEIGESDATLWLMNYRRTHGRPLEAAADVLDAVTEEIGLENLSQLSLTGSGAELVAGKMGIEHINEFKAVAAGLAAMGINARTVFEMGGETSKYVLLDRNDDGSYSILDYATNGDCAAGTGSFIDQQAGRLKYNIEDIGDICLDAERSAQVAGRCSVFAKSDMIHAQQKGYNPAEVLRGLCNAVARNFRTAVVRSHAVEAPVAFIGGVTANKAVVRAMAEAFEMDVDELVIPEEGRAHVPAVGAAAVAAEAGSSFDADSLQRLHASTDRTGGKFPTADPLTMENVILLRDRVETYQPPADGVRVNAFLGIDIGSVSTNLVLLDEEGRLIDEIYVRTKGRPIEVVSDALKQIEADWGDRVTIRGVGTTGSGRELVGELVGADTINDEITCHKTGATFIGNKYLGGRTPDTIFEIGGQDSKYISLQDGIVVDFTMNEACAAGTGSFLEERAEELKISIKGEFADLALSSEAPIRLGERCTVFMERDVNSFMQRGADKADLVAGLAYSVVYNYINRVVRGRKIGDTIFFQGGTAYNNATAAAFSMVTGKEIIVPPHNGVVGAIGSALLARDKMTSPAALRSDAADGTYVTDSDGKQIAETRFRGYHMEDVNYTLREFTCKSCSNHCAIQQFTVEGEKTYWGDKCSEKFRKQSKAAEEPIIEDLVGYRHKLMMDETHLPPVPEDAPTVGIPMAMWALDQLPFWRTLMRHLGYNVVLSDETNNRIIAKGLASVVAEPCHPIIVAHGHIANLGEKGVDHILMPNIISLESRWLHTEAHLCPWHQTLPFVTRRAPALEQYAEKFLTPIVHFREGRKYVARELRRFFKEHGFKGRQVNQAVEEAYIAQDEFTARRYEAGKKALAKLEETGKMGIIMVGRPYNVHDAGMNLSVARKLREYYGVNVVPLDFIDTEAVDIRDINSNMFWELGRRILAAARLIKGKDNLHLIYITNFKCGPDSFIKHFIKKASGKPFLTLQFDGHSNDAGMMTRCEAYLDSKGILRPWRQQPMPVATGAE